MEPGKTVLETGDLQFFFQPKAQAADAEQFELGVQSLFAILSPASGVHRRLRIGRKRMPTSARERFWCRIERVGSLDRVLGGKLEAEYYSTKTRGERYQPAARPIAQGTYSLIGHDDHIHFTYEVEPFGFEDAPDELAVPAEGDHLMLFKAGPDAKATWSPRGSSDRLDREGEQLVLVGRASACS